MRVAKLGDLTNPIDLVSTTPDVPDHILKHRTCWLQVLAYLRSRRIKTSRKQIKSFQLNAPCFLGTIPCRKRSMRSIKCKNANLSVKCKNAISKQQNRKQNKLDSGTFECYFDNLWRSFSEDKKSCFTCLDSLWFSLYTKESSKEKVLRWIKKKNIFSKKYVLVPIVCWSHWSLLIFCNFGESLQSKTRTPCILLLDSLEMANPRRIEPDIRRAENRPETKEAISRIPLLVPKVPQQRNGEECGIFVLYYINMFVKSAPENFLIDGYPYFMEENWFSLEGMELFCKKLNAL
ncbi:probable ubiquitin-like-specific protease 2A isoform X2 [Mangifera indica]|uniref:probable ubiquitin-like-specific protease 2A isoform X2 n=1 Tax=Mangifera indica TaxID=29780 RepID=UPI001CFB02E2|nr:probable ubiquitin-like-specific protease 2A isoform X2 [Mangifera indica]